MSVPSTMLELGTSLPEFELPDYDGNIHSTENLDGKPVLVIFVCNHCPYVKHIADKLSERVREYQENGVEVFAINANDIERYPDDSPEKMKAFAGKHDFSFPYLLDESQEVARAYRAACTPDPFLFDENHRLVYRGQFDGARPGNDVPVTGDDLTEAVNRMLDGEVIPEEDQIPSVGCSIKWKPGNAPDYA